MTRRFVMVCVAIVALLALASPALAKEGAVTKFDSTPNEWHASQAYTLGYMIRMDGVEPYKADTTEIIASSIAGGAALTFPGVGDATPGHYTARVMFPAVGTYHWRVTQGSFFAPFDLGTISVLPAAASSISSAPSAPVTDPLRDVLPFAAAGAVLFGGFVLAHWRIRHALRA